MHIQNNLYQSTQSSLGVFQDRRFQMLAFFLSIIEDPNLKIKFEDIYYAYKNDMLNIIFAILKNILLT